MKRVRSRRRLCNRRETIFHSELGALKVFKLRGDGPKAEEEVQERLKSEIHVLGQQKPDY